MKAFLKNIFFFFLILFIVNHLIVWIYEAPKREAIENNTYPKKLKWDVVHNAKEKIDIIVLGSSRAYNAYNPRVLDSVLHMETLNMGTGSQNIIESYHLLKEIFDHQQPKYIVFDLFTRSVEYKSPDYSHILSNADFLSTKNKFDLIANGFGLDGMMHYTFPLLKYKAYFKSNLGSLLKNEAKKTPEKKWYKGYSEVTKTIAPDVVENLVATKKFRQQEKALQKLEFYLTKIRDLCKKNNAKLVCIRTPYPPKRLSKASFGDQTLSMLFTRISKNLSVPFYDLNYEPNEYSDYDFFDFHHMNKKGAIKASLMLSEILLEEK